VDRVVNAMWTLRRLARAETALFHSRLQGLKADRLANEVRSYEKDISELLYPRPHITDEAAHAEALEALERVRYEWDRDEVLLGRAFDADAKEGDTFGKLARYQRSLERSILRNLKELRQMQDKRRNRRSSSISDAVILDTNDTE
jgi:hypothetical protein